jgi:hypothetical protein
MGKISEFYSGSADFAIFRGAVTGFVEKRRVSQ